MAVWWCDAPTVWANGLMCNRKRCALCSHAFMSIADWTTLIFLSKWNSPSSGMRLNSLVGAVEHTTQAHSFMSMRCVMALIALIFSKVRQCPCRVYWMLGAVFLLSSMSVASSRGFANDKLGLPPLQIPAANLQTAQKIALGKSLFFDKRLSANGSVSCASCHQPDKAFSDGAPLAAGVRGVVGARNTPSLINVAFNPTLFWDGRSISLERQAVSPLLHPHEHGLRDGEQLSILIGRDKKYVAAFRSVFGIKKQAIGVAHVSKALASFQRSLVLGNSPFDRYAYGNDKSALDAGAVRGLELFRGRARCVTCHTIGATHALFTDFDFHSLNVGLDKVSSKLAEIVRSAAAFPDPETAILKNAEFAELGRYLITKDPKDIGKFRTPSLRNVALTAPYMHDGSIPTLGQAIEVEVYYRGLSDGRPMAFTTSEKADLAAFLRALTSSSLLK